MTKQQYDQARDAGERARQAGRKRDSCPLYGMGSDGQAMREAWYSGWDQCNLDREAGNAKAA